MYAYVRVQNSSTFKSQAFSRKVSIHAQKQVEFQIEHMSQKKGGGERAREKVQSRFFLFIALSTRWQNKAC